METGSAAVSKVCQTVGSSTSRRTCARAETTAAAGSAPPSPSARLTRRPIGRPAKIRASIRGSAWSTVVVVAMGQPIRKRSRCAHWPESGSVVRADPVPLNTWTMIFVPAGR
jgi:hypothetical protein